MPANVITLFEFIIPVVAFDVLENEWGYDYGLILDFDEE